MKPKVDYSLYLVTDPDLNSAADLPAAVEQAIQGGCTLIQLREKSADGGRFYQAALAVKQITDRYAVPLIINDRVDIALAVNAAGVHVGQSDIPAAAVRRIIGSDKLLGVSASTAAQAKQAAADGADYLGVGAVFTTGTKTDASPVTRTELANIRKAAPLPIVAIGGINRVTLPLLAGTGIDGVAVVSAIIAQPDITAAARELKQMVGALK